MRSRCACWLVLCAMLVMLGCEGDTGPAGPEGPEGPTGDPGTANVIYSDWYSPAAWEAETEFGIAWRTYTMTTAALTQEIVDQGVVLVYMRFIGYSPEIVQLPVVLPDVQMSFSSRAQAGAVSARYYSLSSPTTSPIVIPSSNQVRYVLIPGGALDGTLKAANETRAETVERLTSLTYDEASRLLGLTD